MNDYGLIPAAEYHSVPLHPLPDTPWDYPEYSHDAIYRLPPASPERSFNGSTALLGEGPVGPRLDSHSFNDRLTSSRRTRTILTTASLLPIVSALSSFFLLLYLLDVYVTLPPTSTGARPRLSLSYSIFPYLSCVGHLREPVFKGLSFISAIFYISTFVADFFISRDITHAFAFRIARLAASVVAAILWTLVPFFSADASTHVHLYVVSVANVAGVSVKFMTYMIEHTMRRRFPPLRKDRIARISQAWKYIVFTGAARKSPFPWPVSYQTLQTHACDSRGHPRHRWDLWVSKPLGDPDARLHLLRAYSHVRYLGLGLSASERSICVVFGV